LVNQQDQADEYIAKMLKEQHGQEAAGKIMKEANDIGSRFNKFDMLDSERLASFYRVMSHLQSEGVLLESSKETVETLMKDIESKASSGEQPQQTGGGSPTSADIIKGKASQIEDALNYLMRNQETLDENQARFIDQLKQADPEAISKDFDPVHKLQRMSMSELTRAYDMLLSMLHTREALIKRRIKSALDHFGVEDRVLHESHDFSKEQEEMPDILGSLYRGDFTGIDEYLSVNEQIQNIHMLNNMTPEQKVYALFTSKVPFEHERNFGEPQLAHARATTVQHERLAVFPEPGATLSQLRWQGRAPMPFHDEALAKINAKVKKVREETDTPFDELYHKERKLVLDIVRLEKILQDIRDTQPNPLANRLIDVDEIVDEHPDFGNVYKQNQESQFVKDQRIRKELEKRQRLPTEAETATASGAYSEFEYN
jgi:hypothetical protein